MSTGEFCDLPDEALVERFKSSRSNAIFTELFRRRRKVIFHCCLAVVGDAATAEDLTQDVFATAYTKIDLFHGGSFLNWLCTIARRLSINYVRSKIPAHETTGLPDGYEVESTQASEAAMMTAEEVRATLRGLTPPQRICLKLLGLGFSYSEISAVTSQSEKEVKTHVQNGKRRFRLLWDRMRGVGKKERTR